MKPDQIRQIVKDKYNSIAIQSDNSCCGNNSCCGQSSEYSVFSESYENKPGYVADADLGLGCGIPTEFADIRAGQHVLDLGSGAGNDCFVAISFAGKNGKVVGLDFSDSMLDKARANAKRLNLNNVEFVKGEIENMPFEDNIFDVVLSNCVLNLVPQKEKAFSEIMRVLKPGGHFCISDVVSIGELPGGFRAHAEAYAGCLSGALPVEKYIDQINYAGFENVNIHKKRMIEIPEEILSRYSETLDIEYFTTGENGLISITLSAHKPSE